MTVQDTTDLARPIAVGVDWITASTRSAKHAKLARQAFEQWEMAAISVGHEPSKPAVLEGYRGLSCAKVFVGERDDGYLTMATSWVADHWIEALSPEGWRPSRLDVQVTAIGGDLDDTFAFRAANACDTYRNTRWRARPYNCSIQHTYGKGDTAIIGSTNSERFAVVYDKHRESKGEYPEGAWRFEVRFRHEYAVEAMAAISQAQSKAQAKEALVRGYLERRGFPMPVEPAAEGLEMTLGKLNTDVDRKLNWLRRFVAPTVRWLIDRGHYSDVLDALGLIVSRP